MNGRHHTRRISGIVATLVAMVGGIISICAATPALASPLPAPGYDGGYAQRPLKVLLVPGMRGWQIVLIALVAALLASVVAVALDRTRSARRQLAPQTS